MNKNLEREIHNLRLESEKNKEYTKLENGLNSAVFLLFRWFLALVLFICGIFLPEINSSEIPDEFKNIPVYVSATYTLEELTDLMDSMEN